MRRYMMGEQQAASARRAMMLPAPVRPCKIEG